MSVLDKILEVAFRDVIVTNTYWLKAFRFSFQIVAGGVVPYRKGTNIYIGIDWLEKNFTKKEMAELMTLRLQGELTKQPVTGVLIFDSVSGEFTKSIQNFDVAVNKAVINISGFDSSISEHLKANKNEVLQCLKRSQRSKI